MSHFTPDFVIQYAGLRVRFGAGMRNRIAEEVERLGHARALVLSTPEQADAARHVAETLGPRSAGVFAGAVMHTPVAVTQTALAHAETVGADCLVAIGGGSTIGLGKAIALRSGLDQIVVPTTYAGSEATPILGQTENGIKTTLIDPATQPEIVLYDPELVATLPVPLTVSSALNAMAHAAEGLYAQNRNPLSSLMAEEGLRAFADALERVVANPGDLDARSETLYGAWLCGTVLGQVGMALHHKLCHTLGGSFDLPHAQTHAVILPHAIGFNAGAAADELAVVGAIFGDDHPGRALYRFAERIGAPLSLRALGLAEADLDRAAEIATAKPYWNPRPVTRADIRALLQAAWEGRAPA
ncbi:maleylacetate reductase [Arsenicitalea aurantiaca]|uniref:Maleylacetate reductase n=1 Tax=Arsenicitalea aurantiaca TaxID=1783274 RepID=A0A433X4A8_9HYPH|nr:maleylacetate reductase [Arsenicitalea aurantiaca]RUT28892.1 maleylacetate reductase [Arsenicitalea aurantiaca]